MSHYASPPWRIKMVESIRMTTRGEREKFLKEAKYNLFGLASRDVYIDMLTDSGTGAMSQEQWSALMRGDEAYAGSRSFERLEATAKKITDYDYILPVHQGRGAEQVILPLLAGDPGKIFISNMHFDTTRAHVILAGARPVDCVSQNCFQIDDPHPFKGNMNLRGMTETVEKYGREKIAGIIMTVTNNSAGGQPVSIKNLREVKKLAEKWGIPVCLDAARYAENAWFIKQREKEYRNQSIRDIVLQMTRYADIFMMSAKKDGLVNMGGLIAVRDNRELYEKCRARMVPLEGFPTYGGLSGRDMDALAVGLEEALEEDYLQHRTDQVRYLGDKLTDAGIRIQLPPGGHAVFVDCTSIAPQIPFDKFPAAAVCNEVYLEGGIRSVEIGSLLLGRDPENGKNMQSPFEWMRLCIPRRTYTYAHLDFAADSIIRAAKRGTMIKGLAFTRETPLLRHFTSEFKPAE